MLVPGDDTPAEGPVGPDYDFWIGRNEVANAAFADFLNDARGDVLSESPDTRGHHMYFDLDSGSVYVSDREAGEEGTPVECIRPVGTSPCSRTH